jgi:hypothetical protein
MADRAGEFAAMRNSCAPQGAVDPGTGARVEGVRGQGGRPQSVRSDAERVELGQAACALPIARTRPDVEIEPLR